MFVNLFQIFFAYDSFFPLTPTLQTTVVTVCVCVRVYDIVPSNGQNTGPLFTKR